jgi:hypothetical protein
VLQRGADPGGGWVHAKRIPISGRRNALRRAEDWTNETLTLDRAPELQVTPCSNGNSRGSLGAFSFESCRSGKYWIYRRTTPVNLRWAGGPNWSRRISERRTDAARHSRPAARPDVIIPQVLFFRPAGPTLWALDPPNVQELRFGLPALAVSQDGEPNQTAAH